MIVFIFDSSVSLQGAACTRTVAAAATLELRCRVVVVVRGGRRLGDCPSFGRIVVIVVVVAALMRQLCM